MKKITLLFSAAFGFSMTIMAQSNGSLQLAKGQKYVVENKLTTTSNTQVQGQAMESNADISTVYNIEVKDMTSNKINLSNTISNLKMNMTMMGQSINFDSDSTNDMNGEIGKTLKDYINQPKGVAIDHSGHFIASTDTSATSGFAQQMDFEASGYGAEMAFLALPKNAKAGDSWTDNYSGDSSIKKTTTYTIKNIADNVATVSLTGTVANTKTMEQNGMEISTKTTGKFSGEEKVNTKTGVIESGNWTIDSAGTVTAMGQDFPTTTKVTSTTTVKTL